jgi:hypothetical protein
MAMWTSFFSIGGLPTTQLLRYLNKSGVEWKLAANEPGPAPSFCLCHDPNPDILGLFCFVGLSSGRD